VTETPAPKKKKRPRGIDEPGLGFGRDVELPIPDAVAAYGRAAFLVLSLGIAGVLMGFAMEPDHRAPIVKFCGIGLATIAIYLVAIVLRHRGRDDLVLRFDHRRFDAPVVALLGPTRVTCNWDEVSTVGLFTGRSGMWIELQLLRGPKVIVPQTWLGTRASPFDLYRTLELRRMLAKRFAGKTPRAALVGAEAMVALTRPDAPIAGVVLSRADSKHPIVIGTVATIEEFFTRLSDWPEDAKLSVPDDVARAIELDLPRAGRLIS
jgi:hypothetical protein